MEGFLEKISSRIDHSLVHDEVRRVTRHEQYLHVRPLFLHLFRQCQPVHSRHNHIRKQQMECSRVLLGEGECICRTGHVQYGKPKAG